MTAFQFLTAKALDQAGLAGRTEYRSIGGAKVIIALGTVKVCAARLENFASADATMGVAPGPHRPLKRAALNFSTAAAGRGLELRRYNP